MTHSHSALRISRILTTISSCFAIVAAVACVSEPVVDGDDRDEATDSPPGDACTATTDRPGCAWISAEHGGAVSLGDEVSLHVPPGSLARDTAISIERVSELPVGESDGFSHAGLAYRFSPPGTEFALDRPAIMTIRLPTADIEQRGLAPRTSQIHYFDEELGRYVNVASRVDLDAGVVTARIEHFTLYVPLAQAMVPGNNPPVVALQNPIPATLRAGAPIYFRTTARDFDIGGSISGVELCVRKLQPAPGAFECQIMTRERRENAGDTHAYRAPASYLGAADLGPGADIEYFARATDNLGAVAATASQLLDVTRTYLPGTLTVQPAVISMTAGSQRVFTARGRDDAFAAFPVIPETASVLNDIGEVLYIEANGVALRADTNAVGGLDLSFGAETASAAIDVFNGSLARLEIRDEAGIPRGGENDDVLRLREGQTHQFSVLGYDELGNDFQVTPLWSSAATLGQPIDQNGLLYTLDGSSEGLVTASLGAVQASATVEISPRSWNLYPGRNSEPFSLNKKTTQHAGPIALSGDGGLPYALWLEPDTEDGSNPGIRQLRVKHWHHGLARWREESESLNLNPTRDAVAPQASRGCDQPHVAWYEVDDSTGVAKMFVKRRSFYQAWQLLSNAGRSWINPHEDRDGVVTDIACGASGAPVVATIECNNSPDCNSTAGERLLVLRHTGSAWVQLGGSLSTPGVDVSQVRLAMDGDTPYVLWAENDGTNRSLQVARREGTAWVAVGGALNLDPTRGIGPASMAFVAGVPFVAWSESDNASVLQLHVKYFDGTAWIQASGANPSGSLNIDSTRRAQTGVRGIDSYNGTPYLVWREVVSGETGLYAAHWNGVAWVQNPGTLSDGSLQLDDSALVGPRELAIIGDTPYAAWTETHDGIHQLYVQALE